MWSVHSGYGGVGFRYGRWVVGGGHEKGGLGQDEPGLGLKWV